MDHKLNIQTLARAATLGSSGCYGVALRAYAGATYARVGAQPRPCAHHPDAGTGCHSGPQRTVRQALVGVRWRIPLLSEDAATPPRPNIQTLARAATLGFSGRYGEPLRAYAGVSYSRGRAQPRPSRSSTRF